MKICLIFLGLMALSISSSWGLPSKTCKAICGTAYADTTAWGKCRSDCGKAFPKGSDLSSCIKSCDDAKDDCEEICKELPS